MKLYDCQPAPSPRRARMLIAEKGLEIETEQVALGDGAQFEPAFRAINPNCTVPVLVLDDGTAICENSGIAAYLEAQYPDPPLLGTTAKEKALVATWNDRCVLEGYSATAEAFRNHARGFADHAVTGPRPFPQLPELVERGRARASDFLATLDQHLAHSPYLAGESFTLADITGYVMVEFAGWIKLGIGDDQPNLRRWHDAIAHRPSASA